VSERAHRLLELAAAVSESAEVLEVEESIFGVRSIPGCGKSFEDCRTTEESLRIVRNGRLGMGSASGLADLPSVVDMAISGSRLGPEVGWEFPGPSDPGTVEMRHPAVDAMVLDDLTGLFLGMEDAVLGEQPHSVVTGRIRRRDVDITLANTSGFEGRYSKALLEFDLEFSFPFRDRMLVEGLRFLSGLPPASPGQICEGIRTRAGWAASEAVLEEESVPVVLAPPVLCTILQSLRACVSGRALVTGGSVLEGREGSRVASETVSVHDRPRLSYGAASAPFDAEGVPTSDRAILERGVFTGFVTDISTAFQLGLKSTGSAGRNTGDHPSPICTNLVFMHGSDSLEDLLGSVPSCAFVTELLPGGSGNALSGDFAFDASSAFLFRSGEPAGHLPGLTVAGNSLDLLARVTGIEGALHGVETDWLPSVMVEGALLRQKV